MGSTTFLWPGEWGFFLFTPEYIFSVPSQVTWPGLWKVLPPSMRKEINGLLGRYFFSVCL